MADDLYSDLDTSVSGLSSVHLKAQLQALQAKYDALQIEAGNLQHANTQLGKRNQILERNISTLYTTAMTEIARKDKAIHALRQELEEIGSRQGRYRESSSFQR